jgi:hypothetical protein
MKKIIRLTESDLTRIVNRLITESFLKKKINDVKPLLSEGFTGSIMGGYINITNDKGKSQKGCVKFTRYNKSKGIWKFDQEWAQGLKEISNGSTLKAKFDFSPVIKYYVPDQLEVITLINKELSGMHYNWSSGDAFQKTLYAKDSKLIPSESGADMKFILTMGGTSTNNYCKSEWN